MRKERLGYIGLGQMGGAMARRLLECGYSMTVYDVRPEAIQELVEKGATEARSPREVAAQSDLVFSSLPNPAIVEEVALSPEGIAAGLRKDAVCIEMSTIDPATVRKIGAALAAKGAHMLDVPVGKGPREAATGKLTLMIGGDPSIVERCKEILNVLGSQHVYCGALGMGATFKIVNNLLSSVISAAVGEALAIGVAAGADPELLREIMMNTNSDNEHIRKTVRMHIFPRDFRPSFKLELAHKDLGLAMQLARNLKVPSIIGSAAHHIHTLALGKGLGNEDRSACVKVFEECSGVEVKGRDQK
jgi:3-hydroxyisobutyrate dehydrogenase-like beta-hydroxyacid dehydrogenase